MAVLFITEFSGRGLEANGATTPMQSAPALAEQVVAIGAASVASAAFNARTRVIRLSADVACSVKIAVTPVATVTTMRLPANEVEYLAIPAGQSYKVAVIANP